MSVHDDRYIATLKDGRAVEFRAGTWPEAMSKANKAKLGDLIVKWQVPSGVFFSVHYKWV